MGFVKVSKKTETTVFVGVSKMHVLRRVFTPIYRCNIKKNIHTYVGKYILKFLKQHLTFQTEEGNLLTFN